MFQDCPNGKLSVTRLETKLNDQGVKCESDGCRLHQSSTEMELIAGDAHIHEYCFNAYKRHRGPKCPKCDRSFDDSEPSFLGEKAATREADHFRTAPGRKRKRPSAAEVEEEETDGEMEDEEGMRSQSQSQSQSQEQSQSQSQSQIQQARPPAARKGVGTTGCWT
jgi:hypothetical protein